MRILIIDNYDSFVYNLVHVLYSLGEQDYHLVKNDQIDLDSVGTYDKILLSPGPGVPREAGLLCDLIQTFGPQKSILGVCLGHQAIGEVFGAKLHNLAGPLHGVQSLVRIAKSDYLFDTLPEEFEIGHYHSWVIDPDTLPPELEVTSFDVDGHIMSIRHMHYDVRGVQFHPESIMTPLGSQIIANWLSK